ncbi:MAG: sigma-70 family RNA polymerase sigma factor [Candidatus Krumholzibacteria bacterium]|nr:sigma-70 family RNA polymerase sigma factor [Candidatus Krumholzibacteria bacterium]
MESGRNTHTDDQLLDRYLAGPESRQGREAADDLLGRYHGRVFQWCQRYVRDPDEALDLAQEAMINAFKGMGGFNRRSRFSSWLFTITRNVCLTAVRRQPGLIRPLDQVPELRSRAANAEEQLQRRQEEEALRLLLGSQLEAHEEEAFWLRVVEKMSVDQITRVLNLDNASGARSVLQNARRKLHRVWGDRMDQFKGVDQ